MVSYFCHYMSVHVGPGVLFFFFFFFIIIYFILDTRLAWPIFWERNYPFGFLLVVF